jgi:hypothetical protein
VRRTRRARLAIVAGVCTTLVAGLALTARADTQGPAPVQLGSQLGEAAATTSDVVVTPRSPLVFGTAAPTKTNLLAQEAIAGRPIVAVRIYRQWDDKLFGPDQIWERDTWHTLFLSIKPRHADGSIVTWSQIADATPGTPVYDDMLSMAQQIKDFGDRVFVTLSHEPDADGGTAFGTGADFIAAFRAFVTLMRQQQVGNFVPTAIFTGWGFTRQDARNIDNFYPGDAYVSVVGVDLYNWGDCKNRPWKDMAQILESARQWGVGHPAVTLMITEYGSVEDPNDPTAKAQWITDAAQLLEQPGYEQFAGLFAWGALNDHTDCPFGYDTSPQAQAAWVAVGHDPDYDAWE